MSLREQLQEVIGTYGRLTNENLVAAATPTDHPLHHRFEWDNGVAGHKYRLVQAAELIRSVKVSYVSPTSAEPHSVRAFHSVTPEGSPTPVYTPVEEVLADPVARELLVREMRRDWARFQARYQHLEEFIELVASASRAA